MCVVLSGLEEFLHTCVLISTQMNTIYRCMLGIGYPWTVGSDSHRVPLQILGVCSSSSSLPSRTLLWTPATSPLDFQFHLLNSERLASVWVATVCTMSWRLSPVSKLEFTSFVSHLLGITVLCSLLSHDLWADFL